MSDRVAIIGGSTVGRDHFPFPVPNSIGEQINYPFSTDLDHFVHWFYRIKKWHMEIGIEAFDPTTSTTYNGALSFDFRDSSYTDPEDVETAFLATREADLVLPRFGTGLAWTDAAGTYLPDDESEHPNTVVTNYVSNFVENPNFEVFFTYAVPLYESGLFRCEFGFQGGYNGQILGSDIPSESGVGQVNISTLDDLFIADLTASTPLGGRFITEMSLIISPAEYWPYATKAGLPVYDTSTGAQLRDPLS